MGSSGRGLCKVAAVGLLAAMSGCGGRGQDLASVTGVLTVAGKPYPGGRVIFSPKSTGDDLVAGRPSFGITDEQGRFSLSCFEQDDGAVVGEHTVTFFRGEDDTKSRPDLQGLGFNRVTLPSGRVSVKSGHNQIDITFTLEDIKKHGNRI